MGSSDESKSGARLWREDEKGQSRFRRGYGAAICRHRVRGPALTGNVREVAPS